MIKLYNWNIERFLFVINSLLIEGIVWLDDNNINEKRYYFPSLWKTL